MEADWDEITRIAVPPPGPHAIPAAASCVIAFDDAQELLWTGNERVSSQFSFLLSFAANHLSGSCHFVLWS